MSFLAILFWILVILGVLGGFAGTTNPNGPYTRYGWVPVIVLIIILGIRVFSVALR